jgi:hypothetical protein
MLLWETIATNGEVLKYFCFGEYWITPKQNNDSFNFKAAFGGYSLGTFPTITQAMVACEKHYGIQ